VDLDRIGNPAEAIRDYPGAAYMGVTACARDLQMLVRTGETDLAHFVRMRSGAFCGLTIIRSIDDDGFVFCGQMSRRLVGKLDGDVEAHVVVRGRGCSGRRRDFRSGGGVALS